MLVKKVDTFKSGRFVFSREYDREKIRPMVAEAMVKYMTVAALPILPDVATQLESDLIRRAIHGTAAIEGNPLSEEEVGRVLAGHETEKTLARTKQEILNLKAAYELADTMHDKEESSFLSLSEDFIRMMNETITNDIEYELHSPGQYRNYRVEVGNKEHGGVYVPPKILAEVKALMTEFVTWINSDALRSEESVIRAALAHYHLGLIHPFGDGNGRTARIIESTMMSVSGMKFVPKMMSNYYYKNLDEYYIVFTASERNKENDVTPFVDFFCRGLLESVSEIQNTIFSFIRNFVLKNYLEDMRSTREINQRQYDLLMQLMESDSRFTLKSLFSPPFQPLYRSVSEATARRDLAKLLEMKLLNKQDDQYTLNTRVLDHLKS